MEKTVYTLLKVFYKLFEKIADLEEMEPLYLEELDLEPYFEIGSKCVELNEINEKDQARFLVTLVQ